VTALRLCDHACDPCDCVEPELEMLSRIVVARIDDGSPFALIGESITLLPRAVADHTREKQIGPLKSQIYSTDRAGFRPIMFDLAVVDVSDLALAIGAFSVEESVKRLFHLDVSVTVPCPFPRGVCLGASKFVKPTIGILLKYRGSRSPDYLDHFRFSAK
jgi:hypothetical protein